MQEAIARKINLITGETKNDVAVRTGRPIIEIHEDEYDAVVIHGDQIDGLQGWEWDQMCVSHARWSRLTGRQFLQDGGCLCAHEPEAQA